MTRIISLPRLAARATTTLCIVTAVAACSSGSDTRTDSAAGSADVAPAAAAQPSMSTPADSAATATAAATTGAAAAAGALLDPNAATREQLVAVPGMTAAAADALIAGRPYPSMVAVDQALAKHLGAPERKTVYAQLFKPIDLNTAAGPEILLIPGVGARMRHEFEEYRPYKSIEQFRREIGKYVDKDEVARLEKYVVVK
jgi:hypothetical protein